MALLFVNKVKAFIEKRKLKLKLLSKCKTLQIFFQVFSENILQNSRKNEKNRF